MPKSNISAIDRQILNEPDKSAQTEKCLAHYDYYDYESYWQGREYEYMSDVIALSDLLQKAPGARKQVIDVGGGMGRLTKYYAPLFEKAVLLDSSSTQIEKAKKIGNKYSNVSFVQGFAEKLPFKNNYADAIVCVRVSHHIENFHLAIRECERVLVPGGCLILEVANKLNIKARIRALLRGELKKLYSADFKYIGVQEKQDNNNAIVFVNHNPHTIERELVDAGFKIIARRSVSNFRLPFFKKVFSTKVLIFFEKIVQPILAPFRFGPSIFFLAEKKIG